jgi:hypothetical protein
MLQSAAKLRSEGIHREYGILEQNRLSQEGQLLDKKSLRSVCDRKDIHQRTGLEIPRSRIRRSIEQLVNDGKLRP